jgi:hypothetical protein
MPITPKSIGAAEEVPQAKPTTAEMPDLPDTQGEDMQRWWHDVRKNERGIGERESTGVNKTIFGRRGF